MIPETEIVFFRDPFFAKLKELVERAGGLAEITIPCCAACLEIQDELQ